MGRTTRTTEDTLYQFNNHCSVRCAFESLFPGRPPLPLVGAVVVVVVLLLLNCVTNNSYFPKDRFRPN